MPHNILITHCFTLMDEKLCINFVLYIEAELKLYEPYLNIRYVVVTLRKNRESGNMKNNKSD